MPCELVHDWPWWPSEGKGFTCQACGVFVTEAAVRSKDPGGYGTLVPSWVLDDIVAARQRFMRDETFL